MPGVVIQPLLRNSREAFGGGNFLRAVSRVVRPYTLQNSMKGNRLRDADGDIEHGDPVLCLLLCWRKLRPTRCTCEIVHFEA